ncbi:MAG: prepilin peptidase, partial [Bacillota bacterium]|nr:prepilin peptidase [Bacillota bacterium]
MIYYYITVLFFGLVIGSFLNVVIWRVPRNESISFPPSHCPKCGSRIK